MSRIAIACFAAAAALASAGTAAGQSPETSGDASDEAAGAAEQAAEPSDADKARARKLLAAGDRLLQRGDRLARRGRDDRAAADYERALEHYEQAYQLVPNPSIYFPIGQAKERLGRHLDALGHYLQVLDESPGLGDDLRQAVEARIDSARQHVATLIVTASTPGVAITVDGEPRGTTPLDRPIFLPPGDHAVTAAADGLIQQEITVTIDAGAEREHRFELERVPVEPEPEPEPARPAVVVPDPPSRAGLLVGGIITAALAGGATATGLATLSKQGTLDDTSASIEDRDAARDAGKTLALATDLLIVGAALAGAYTTYHYLKVYRPRRAEYERRRDAARAAAGPQVWQPKVWVAPIVYSGGGGMALGGHF